MTRIGFCCNCLSTPVRAASGTRDNEGLAGAGR